MTARFGIFLLCVLGAVVALGFLFAHIFTGSLRFWWIAIGIDNAVSAIFGGNGYITISERAARARKRGDRWGCYLCRLLDWADPDHCKKSLR